MPKAERSSHHRVLRSRLWWPTARLWSFWIVLQRLD